MKKFNTLKEAINSAKELHIEKYDVSANQFNVQRFKDGEDFMWSAEFMETEGAWEKCTTFFSDEEARGIFDSEITDKITDRIDTLWDEEWDELLGG